MLDKLGEQGIAIRVASPKLVMEEAPESYKDVCAVVDTCHDANNSIIARCHSSTTLMKQYCWCGIPTTRYCVICGRNIYKCMQGMYLHYIEILKGFIRNTVIRDALIVTQLAYCRVDFPKRKDL